MLSRILGIALLGTLTGLLGTAPVHALGTQRNGPAIPITSLPFLINAPGNYALVGNLRGSAGIIINASHVTVDLGGYALIGAGAGDGILVRGDRSDISVHDGTVSAWSGVGIMADTAFNGSFSNLRLSDNGLCGLRAGHGAVITNVSSQANGGSGVVGFEAVVVTGGSFTGNASFGVEVGSGSVVSGVAVVRNLGGGIFADAGSRIAGNAVNGNGHAVTTTDGGCSAATLAGIAVLGSGSTVVDNTVTGNLIGLQLIGSGNTVDRNLVKGSGRNYEFAEGNQLQLLLSEVPQSIDWPAVVTLAGSLTGTSGMAGLTVRSSDVSIDLAGHALKGVPGSLSGIAVPASVSRLSVRNGTLTGWGDRGIDALLADTSVFQDLIATANAGQGLRTGNRCSLRGVVTSANGIDGILTGSDCLVSECIANGNANDGLHVGEHSTVTGCEASENTLFGIKVADGSSVRGSTASHNNYGISAEDGATIADCTASFNTGVAIRAMSGCTITGNFCRHSGYGIAVLGGTGSRVDGNNLTGNQIGIAVPATGNFIVRNSVSGSSQANFDLNENNAFGTILRVGTGTFVSNDPWANFSF